MHNEDWFSHKTNEIDCWEMYAKGDRCVKWGKQDSEKQVSRFLSSVNHTRKTIWLPLNDTYLWMTESRWRAKGPVREKRGRKQRNMGWRWSQTTIYLEEIGFVKPIALCNSMTIYQFKPDFEGNAMGLLCSVELIFQRLLESFLCLGWMGVFYKLPLRYSFCFLWVV